MVEVIPACRRDSETSGCTVELSSVKGPYLGRGSDRPGAPGVAFNGLPEVPPLSRRIWSAPGFVEPRYWTSCHDGCVLVLYRGEHAQLAVTALPVVEDLQVVEDRVGQLDTGAPALPAEKLDRYA